MSLVAGIVILLICCIGNAELWVILINRLHALRFRHSDLQKMRKLHDVGLVVIPLVLIFSIGFGRNGLLLGGAFSELSLVKQGLLVLTGLGLIPFLIGVLRFQMRRQPVRMSTTDSTILKPLSEASASAVINSMYGDAPRFLRRFPGNQVWELEVSRKRIVIPRRRNQPAADLSQKSMTLAHFTDVHFTGCPGEAWQEFLFDELIKLKPDAFVFTGDLLDRSDWLPFAAKQFKRLAEMAPGYFILGNHDWHLDWEAIREDLTATGWMDLGESYTEATLNGCQVLLAGTEAPWLGQNPEVPVAAKEDFRVLLSHAPDQRDYAIANDFDLMLAGHNHGGQITLPLIGPVYSPSRFGVRYAGGCFEHKGMLMHVSRGTGAKDSLRLRCPPEISLLTLAQADG